MNESKYLDSCIQTLKVMMGDQSNELESEQRRALAEEIRKLKRLKKRSRIGRDELYRIVSEIAEAVSKILWP
jgi:hypothetical protein